MSIAQSTGLIGYFSLAVQQRIAKDASLCPQTEQEIELAEMSARAWQNYQIITPIAQSYQVDMATSMHRFLGLMEQMEARLRPIDWYERLVKSYVLLGVISDLNTQIARLLEGNMIDAQAAGIAGLSDPMARRNALEEVNDISWDCGYITWAQPYIKQACQTQETLSSRLSLWGRRVLGDVITTIRQAVTAHPDLFSLEGLDQDTLLSLLNQEHHKRMESAGLKG